MKILNLVETPGYMKTLARWHHNEWSYLNPQKTFEERMKRMEKYLGEDFVPTTYVAVDGKLLGSAAIVSVDLEQRSNLSPWLASVFVSPEFRKKGVGSGLVRHVMDQAKLNGVEVLYLYTPDKEMFYRNLGWETIEKMGLNGTNITIMRVGLN